MSLSGICAAQRDVTRALFEFQAFGVPSCSALSILEVQVGVKKGEEAKTDLFLGSLVVVDVPRKMRTKPPYRSGNCEQKGMIDLPDAIIAATCLVHGLTLVTYNKKHYPFPKTRLPSPFRACRSAVRCLIK